jgi:hypothetical protein
MSSSYIPAALRCLVCERANYCCEYCLIPEAFTFAVHEIDHIVAKKHDGKTVAENLALSCTFCNKYKGSDLASIDPETGAITPLYHPRKHKWSEIFEVKDDGRVIPLTPNGRVTTRLLQLNQEKRIEERKLMIGAGIIKLSKL